MGSRPPHWGREMIGFTVSLAQMAETLGTDAAAVRDAVKRGEIRAQGDRISVIDLARWQNARRTAPSTPSTAQPARRKFAPYGGQQ